MALKNDDGEYETLMFEREIPLLWDILIAQAPTVIIIERFQPYGRDTRISPDGLATIEICGSVYAIAHILHSQLIIQEAIQRLPFKSDAERLLPQLTKAKIDSHQIDAMAHLLRYERVGAKGNKYPPQLGLQAHATT